MTSAVTHAPHRQRSAQLRLIFSASQGPTAALKPTHSRNRRHAVNRSNEAASDLTAGLASRDKRAPRFVFTMSAARTGSTPLNLSLPIKRMTEVKMTAVTTFVAAALHAVTAREFLNATRPPTPLTARCRTPASRRYREGVTTMTMRGAKRVSDLASATCLSTCSGGV